MCGYCRQQDHWFIEVADIKNGSDQLQYVVDAYTGRIVEIKPGETKQVYAKVQRS
jgi:uncharacterized membrane protein YkoI